MKTSLKMLYLNSVLFLGLSSIGISEAFTLSSTNASPTRSEHRRRSGLFCATTDVRGTAVGSKFESWYQKTIESLSLVEPLVPIELEDSFSSNVGSLGKMNMTFRSMAWQSKSLRYIRLISFVGEGYDVFNFMAVPRAGTAVPILGIDVVSLPRGALAAIDFQPHNTDPSIYSLGQYTCLQDIHERYKALLPSGGEMKDDTKRFFSPYATWTRIPGASDSSEGNEVSMDSVGDAVDEYVRAYSKLIDSAAPRSEGVHAIAGAGGDAEGYINEEYLEFYLSYRTLKDPARRLLTGAFGNEWTEEVLKNVMFPLTSGAPLLHSAASSAEPLAHQEQQEVDHNGNGQARELSKIIPDQVTFVTGNEKKRQEVEEILRTYQTPFKLISEKVDLPEIQGESLDIAVEKCRVAANILGGPVITEDTSLHFHALKGLPGPYIKWFLEKLGHDGLNNLLLAYPDKSAYAQCIAAYCGGPGQEVKTFVGRTEGHIVPAASLPSEGTALPAFGWDAIFKPLGFQETYAQIPKDVKNKISHRYKAFAQLASYLGGTII